LHPMPPRPRGPIRPPPLPSRPPHAQQVSPRRTRAKCLCPIPTRWPFHAGLRPTSLSRAPQALPVQLMSGSTPGHKWFRWMLLQLLRHACRQSHKPKRFMYRKPHLRLLSPQLALQPSLVARQNAHHHFLPHSRPCLSAALPHLYPGRWPPPRCLRLSALPSYPIPAMSRRVPTSSRVAHRVRPPPVGQPPSCTNPSLTSSSKLPA
jgi:hypothetical protein